MLLVTRDGMTQSFIQMGEANTSYILNHLEPQSTYFMRVAATNVAGTSDFSSTVSLKTPAGKNSYIKIIQLNEKIQGFKYMYISGLYTSKFHFH